MRRAVVLQHRLCDGSAHLDWLFERDAGTNPDARSLIAFRVEVRPDRLSEGAFAAQRIDDHRRLYLDYEGPIASDRGDVTRLATGDIANLEERDGSICVVIDWGAGPVRYVGAVKAAERNAVGRASRPSAGGAETTAETAIPLFNDKQQWRFTVSPTASR